MPHWRQFTVVPQIPERMGRLREIAYNLYWTWHPAAAELFRRLDPGLWVETGNNPVALLGEISQERLAEAAEDPAYLAHYDEVVSRFEEYLSAERWFDKHHAPLRGHVVAYFCAEFGLHECLPIYSGGLGALAGDHLRSASDLGLPLVGVGLLYRQGYFHQFLTNDGWQFEDYPSLEFGRCPVQPVRGEDGSEVRVAVRVGERDVQARLWRIQVGRVPVYLLDCDVPENHPEDRHITARLYAGDQDMRIRQEIMLGIGGVRALDALGIDPVVCHMNEGHSAFLALERICLLMKKHGLTFEQAQEAATAGSLFTTHTPVPAGIDTFPPDLVRRYLGGYCEANGIEMDRLLSLGRVEPDNPHEGFSMAVLALRTSAMANGVSRLHGEVSRRMWARVWPGVPACEAPIGSITNGVHLATWVSSEMASLFERYLGPGWREDPCDEALWANVDRIPDAELWRSFERQRAQLVAEVRQRLRRQLEARGAPAAEIVAADEVLDPEALTVGFARRFAPYKRATLLLQDPERLERLLADTDRPVQFVIAGKAHPRDDIGKGLIRDIVRFAHRPGVRRRFVFIEDYDLGFARAIVHGVDVWLNTPRRLMEASGTSGMKVAPNGGLNASIPDGWWPEAADGTNGWTIGGTRLLHGGDGEFQDQRDAAALYELLEQEIVPLFYERGADGLPRRWLARVKASLRTIPWRFNTHRMLHEYTEQMYVPSMERFLRLKRDGFAGAARLAEWKRRLREHWSEVCVEEVEADASSEMAVGARIHVRARVRLGAIGPEDVAVEVFYGLLNEEGEITEGRVCPMRLAGGSDNGVYTYQGVVPCERSGRFGYAVRVRPEGHDVPQGLQLGLICWGE